MTDLSAANLRRLELERALPLALPSMTVPEAIALARHLPQVEGMDHAGNPRGWGLFPPPALAVVVKLGRARKDLFLEPVPRGAAGVLGCAWRGTAPDRTAIRLWFRSEPGKGYQAADGQWARVVDSYDDAIGSLCKMPGFDPLQSTAGWSVSRLDRPPETAETVPADNREAS